jgi:pimeloyl-ACP methyl ester carboxylesterase
MMSLAVPHTEPALVRANGIEICYDTFGDPSSPALLLIDGWGCQMIEWDDEFCAQLAARGYWVIRHDNRDVGLSTKFHEAGVPDLEALEQARRRGEAVQAPYTLKDMAEDAIGLMDALGIRRAHAVGISMGGMIVQMMAIYHPERLCSMIPIMSTTHEPGLPPRTPEAQAAAKWPQPKTREEYIEHYVRWGSLVSGERYRDDPTRLRALAARLWDRGLSAAGHARQGAAIIATPGWREALKSVGVPTLVIHGDADPLLPLEHGLDIARAVPGAKILIIKDWGHGYPAPALWPTLLEAIARHAKSPCPPVA